MIRDYSGLKAKHVSFCNSYGSDEDQLNRILKLQKDVLGRFKIFKIIPIFNNGTNYFWFFYDGEFPDEKEYRKK